MGHHNQSKVDVPKPGTGPNKSLDRMRGSAVSHIPQSSVTGALHLIGQLYR
jgi:hypothetical protein